MSKSNPQEQEQVTFGTDWWEFPPQNSHTSHHWLFAGI